MASKERQANSDESQPTALVAVVDSTLPANLPAERNFADLYVRWYPQFFRTARRALEKDAARDAVHDVLVGLWERWKELTPESRHPAAITTAVRNRAIDIALRDAKSVELTEELEESGAVPLVPAVDSEDPPELAQVRDAILEQLTPRSREAYLLVNEDGFTYKQAAAAMGIGFESVKTHLKIANILIREALVGSGYQIAAGEATKALLPAADSSEASDD